MAYFIGAMFAVYFAGMKVGATVKLIKGLGNGA
jgi:hypothetical protein